MSAQPTPQEREARIAELRARRHARLRVLALRSALGIAALALLIALALYWLLSTLGGRDFLLAQIVARLPAGTELQWRRAEGPASGPLTLHGVRFVQRGCPDRDGEPVPFGQCPAPTALHFTAERVTLDPDIRPLLGRLLRLDALDVVGAELTLPASDEPFELPRWPESLPEIAPPLALQADTIRIDGFRVIGADGPVIDIRRLRGGLDARDGRLRLQRIEMDSDRGRFTAHGEYAPRDDYRTDLTVSALLPAPPARTRPRFGLVARGDLEQMDVALSGHAPAPLRAQLTLRGREDAPRWRLTASSKAFDPALLTGAAPAAEPLAFDLRGDGVGGAATLQGTLRRGAFAATLQPSQLRLENQVLELRPLVLDVFDGRITARGRGDFSAPGDARFRLAINARGLRWGGDVDDDGEASAVIAADADFGIAGRTAAWAAIGKATLARDEQRATLDFDGRGNAQGMRLRSLRAAMPSGRLDARGDVAWAPALGWTLDAELAGFDPGYFAPQFKGAVDGTLASRGRTRDDGGLDIEVEAERLAGTLRGRKLQGRATFAMQGAAPGADRSDYAGEVALSLGGSRIEGRGRVAQTLDIDATLSPLRLDDLLPDAAGSVRGTLRMTGPRTAPNVVADLGGNALRYGDTRVDAAQLRGQLPWRNGSGDLQLDARGVNAGVAFDSLSLRARGAVEDVRVEGSASSAMLGTLALAGEARSRGGNWQGTLSTLSLDPPKGAQWRLQSPARFAQRGGNWTLSQSCFASTAGGTLCADAEWPRRGLRVEGQGLPLALAAPYLPARDDGRPWLLGGEIALTAELRPAGDAFRGSVQIDSASGGLRLSQRARSDLISYQNLDLDLQFDPRRIEATLAAGVNRDGRIDARIVTGWDAYAPLSGEIALNTEQLIWMELLSPDIVEPSGRLEGRITLGGTRAQPTLGGQAQLSRFAAEVPALAIALQDGNLRLDAQPDGSARIDGSVGTGEGTLLIAGSLGWQGDDTPLQLSIRGSNVLVADTSDLRAVVSPDVQVRYAARQPLSVSGSVVVPSARLDLERLDDGVSTSPDVVVLDPIDPERDTAATPLELDLLLRLGEDVRLNGFGLDGTLAGSLRVRARPGREMTALGTLNVGGEYRAYGQELRIVRGGLIWSNGPIGDPILDIRAERRIEGENITAGIDVDGRASAPRAQVWTDPPTDDSEALSYLALGRPLAGLSGAQGRQIDAASAALSAGGSLLASQLGASLGLDDAGVTQSRALGGSVVGIGKYLSPRLYVGYGVSLLGTGQVLTLKYLLDRGFDIEIESSSIENRGSINWRKEK